jgi:type II secretory pathway component GspD/PulD (secretin)
MRRPAIAAFALFAAAAWGQDVSRVYHFEIVKTAEGCQQVANVIRMIGDIRDVSADATAKTLSTHGTADQMALTDWLFPRLEQPDSRQYQMAAGDLVHVFPLAHTGRPADAQEIVNILRTAGDILRVFPVWDTRSIVARGSADQIALAEWLVPQLDAAEPTPAAPTQAHQFADWRAPEVRVIHVAHSATARSLQELVNAVRTIANINRVFPCNTPQILVVRGTAESVAVAEWLLGQLDQPAGQQGPAPHEQQLKSQSEGVHVFYLSHADTPQAVQEIANAVRTTANVNRVWPCNQSKALAVRGSAEQVKEVEKLIAQLDR